MQVMRTVQQAMPTKCMTPRLSKHTEDFCAHFQNSVFSEVALLGRGGPNAERLLCQTHMRSVSVSLAVYSYSGNTYATIRHFMLELVASLANLHQSEDLRQVLGSMLCSAHRSAMLGSCSPSLCAVCITLHAISPLFAMRSLLMLRG